MTSTSCRLPRVAEPFFRRALATLQRLALKAMLLVLPGSLLAAQDTGTPRITAVRAQLYYEETGTLSDDVLSREFEFWNTIIGEGDADHASNFTLITVEISGQNVSSDALIAEISATADGKILEQREVPVSLYDDKVRFYAPLLLYGTGCQKILVSARLLDSGAEISVEQKTIPFECGE